VTTLAELRAIVRTQTQTDSADLPDVTIDVYLQQAFERTLAGETRWPFYAKSWALVQNPDEGMITLPGDVNAPGILALTDPNGARLGMVPQVWAEDNFRGNSAGTMSPKLYSVWGNELHLWPALTYTEPRNYRLRGYRWAPLWLDANQEPDCDKRLHLPLTHYACALAYAQQEDEVLEATYMARWQADVELAHRAIMDPIHHRPLTMAGSVQLSTGHAQEWVMVLPPVTP